MYVEKHPYPSQRRIRSSAPSHARHTRGFENFLEQIWPALTGRRFRQEDRDRCKIWNHVSPVSCTSSIRVSQLFFKTGDNGKYDVPTAMSDSAVSKPATYDKILFHP